MGTQAIKNAARQLEEHTVAEYGLQIEESVSRHGPSYMFDLNIYLRLLLDGYQLSQYAMSGSSEKPVLIAYTLDGAQLTMNLGHVTAGVKIVDPRAIDPSTGVVVPVCLMQSRDLCFPCQITF